jgi:hypothetical protein
MKIKIGFQLSSGLFFPNGEISVNFGSFREREKNSGHAGNVWLALRI